MRSYEIVVRTEARDDLLSIVQYLATDYPSAASRVIDEFESAIQSLHMLPERGARFLDSRIPSTIYWRWIDRRRKYRLLYRLRGTTVVVVHVRIKGSPVPPSRLAE